ncbi:calcium-binding protein, partial [Pseudomonas sp. MWU12-2534b]
MAIINGTNGADTLTGTAGYDEINALGVNDVIKSSPGADKIDGGAGFDTIDYSASPAGVNVEVRLGTVPAGKGGDAEGSTLTGIENVIGSAFNDILTSGPVASATAIRLEGGAGHVLHFI